jgi:hypothetical protein
MPPPNRPPFIVSTADVPETTHRYPKSEEPMGPTRAIGRAAGLLKRVSSRSAVRRSSGTERRLP